MINVKLVVVGGDAKRTEVHLKQLPATIGRARDASITLPHPLVSRKHCEIFEENDQLFVKDLESLNGTYLNNKKIDGAQAMLPGQLLTLGNVTFRAVFEADAATATATATTTGTGTVAAAFDSVANFCSTERSSHDQTVKVDPHLTERAPLAANADSSEIDTEHGAPAHPNIDAFTNDVDPGTADTDNDDTDSHRFVLDDETAVAEKSISLGAIDELPAVAAQLSFAGNLEIDDEIRPTESRPVNIDLGPDTKPESDPSKSSLDQFFRKIPK